jgi:hypothetical protein
VAIIVAPTAGVASRSGIGGWIRGQARRRLRLEQRALARAGVRSLAIEPGSGVIAQMGVDLMDGARSRDITREAFLDAGRQLVVGQGFRVLAA